MAKQQTFEPPVHGKAAVTGKGQVAKTPGNAAGDPAQNHIPKLGKPAPGGGYSSEQQQK